MGEAAQLERFVGLEYLASAVLVCDRQGAVLYANSAAEDLLDASLRTLHTGTLEHLFGDRELELTAFIRRCLLDPFDTKRAILMLRGILGRPKQVHVTCSWAFDCLAVELREIDQQIRIERDFRMLSQSIANKELIRNLAHEIRNPLGGVRGAAQLLEAELPSASLKEYTQVIIRESDRLQTLLDQLLEPHRSPHLSKPMNIHEVCEHVRGLLLAQYPDGLQIVRDYDVSIPEFLGDSEQLIQVLLNIMRNAAQALQSKIDSKRATIKVSTRVVRKVTINNKQHRLALDLKVVDNGPGIEPGLLGQVFFPLVSGREGGTGLGLTLAQTFVQQHGGSIQCASRQGCTEFCILLPLGGILNLA